jgi:aspartate carbamoyltransferase catalytic subunit
MRHIVGTQQFTPEFIERMYHRTVEFKKGSHLSKANEHCKGRILGSLFYEPSTRTRWSFDVAAIKLGMHVVFSDNAKDFSSAIKGEVLSDTIRVLGGFMLDVMVIRHSDEGSAQEAADLNVVPIINGGDGIGQHPTQALLDAFTVIEKKGRLDHLTFVIGGDLARGRTVRSLAYLIGKYPGNRIIGVAPPEMGMRADIKDYLLRHNVPYQETDQVEDALQQADVVYWTRPQNERALPGGIKIDASRMVEIMYHFMLGSAHLAVMKKDAILLHPLPRTFEIRKEVDLDPRAWFIQQSHNGPPLRMSILEYVCAG